MNKHLHNSLRALCLSLAVLLSLPMLAVTVEIDGINYDLNAEAKQATVIAKSIGTYSGEVVIPESVEHESVAYSVTSIGNEAFSSCSGLTSVTIPNSVTSIGERAFEECTGLTSVHISDIAAWCNIDFANYNSNPLYDAHHLYLDGEEVKDLIIPNSVTSIGEYAFYGCSGLTSVTIGNSVTSIGHAAFSNCSGLTSVTIPNSVTSIENGAFSGCSGLTSVTIPNSVTSIGEWAFSGCSGLTSVTIPNSVTSIGEWAFSGCSGLTSVHISDIAAWCNIDFANYNSNPLYDAHHLYLDGEEVKDLIIPNSVTSIGNYAFERCSGLTSVTIPNSVTSIGKWAFLSCSGLTSVTIPNSVTSIGGSAFQHCSGLTSVTIGNSVTSIGEYAFSGCSGLTSVVVEDGNPVYDSRNNCNAIIETATNTLHSGCKTTIIPNSVTSIGQSAFGSCTGLTSVTIPNSVTSIENGAFSDCSGLTSVTIPNSVTSIGEWAFSDCSGLTSVTIPNSVTSIGKWAFLSCSGLTSVHISDIAAWCNIDFVDYYSNPLHYAHHLYLNGEEVKDLVIPNSVTSIGDIAFRACSGLTSVTIPNSVTSIGNYAFDNCSGLTSVTIPNSVTRIGDVAFWGCSGLTSVTIPNSVTSIGYRVFYNCSGLTSVTIPNSVTSIGQEAFEGCSGLTSVTIGNSVTSIGSEAFANCTELHDLYCYAEEVPSTENNAFINSPIQNATLHVPYASIDSYKATAPWNGFGTITPLPNLTLTDGEEFENNTEQPFSTLTYTRTLPNMLWNPLYVPFKIPYEDLEENYEVAYINAMHSYDNDDNGEIDEMVMEIVKIKAGTLKPNHPYLIKAKNEEAKVMNIVQETATLYPAEITTLDCSSVYTKFEITGTYQKMTSEELNGSLVISTDGAWKKLSATSTLKPFRFYLTISSREGSPVEIAEDAMSRVRIRVMGEDDNATGIDEVKTANDEQKSEIYDLSGRRVSAPAKGGVYIIKGKKVIY